MVTKTSDVNEANQIPDATVRTAELDDENERLREIRERFAAMQTFWGEIHKVALRDDRFVAGKQWDDQIRKDREEAGRPMLTYNLLPSFTRQIINKVRQNRPQMRVKPVESDRYQTPTIQNVQGTQDYSVADVYMGIIRNIEHLSRADHAYDTALQHAVNHSFGYFYLTTEYSRFNPWAQDFRIKRVKNSYSVLLDPSAQEVDYSDAQDAFVFTNISRAAFKRKYPDHAPHEHSGGMGGTYEGWYDGDNLQIAEYRWIEYVDDEVLMLTNGAIVFHSDVKDVLDDMEEESGVRVADDGGQEMRKAVKRPKCMWLKMTGSQILDGPRETVFSMVPVFPVLGDELLVDGRVIYQSAIRDAIDPQKSYNYWRTAAAETVALHPKAPWILTEDQVEGHEDMWEKANVENQPYLAYNYIDGQPTPSRNFPAQVAAAELSNATQDGRDMQTIIGLHDASLGREGNEKSGKAILARQQQGATSTFTFPDNLNRALEAMGRCLVDAIPRVYDTQRVVRIRLPEDVEDFVEINKTVTDEETGKEQLVHDLGYGQYDVVIETGPSYATQRQEAVEVLIELMKTLPAEVSQMIAHLVVKNMGVPGADEVSAILRKMLPDNLKSEDERAADLPKGVVFDEQGNPVVEKTGEPYRPPPTPEQQLAQRQQELKQAEIDADLAETEADKAQAQAKLKQAEADLVEAEARMAEATSGQDRAPADPQATEQALRERRDQIEQVVQQMLERAGLTAPEFDARITEAIVDALKRARAYVDRQLAKQRGQAGDDQAA